MHIGYARCSTIQQDQDLTAQRAALAGLGVDADRVYTDVGRSGTNRDRPGLREALAALRDGDTLVVTKLDRLARSVRDAADIAAEVENRGAKLSLGGSVHDPHDPMGRLLFNLLSMMSEFEADLIRQRTREGMAVARARGRSEERRRSSPPHRTDTWRARGSGRIRRRSRSTHEHWSCDRIPRSGACKGEGDGRMTNDREFSDLMIKRAGA